jgi:hypothetical protein
MLQQCVLALLASMTVKTRLQASMSSLWVWQALCSQVIKQEPLVSENRRPALRQLMERLLEKQAETQHHNFSLYKVG